MPEFIRSSRSYFIGNVSENRGTSPATVQYFLLFIGIYIVVLVILHKIYRGLCVLSKTRKASFLLACDTILYQYQKKTPGEYIPRIQDYIKSGSYEENYENFLAKASGLGGDLGQQLSSKLKSEYNTYKISGGTKKMLGSILLLITLGVYFLFLEN